MRNLLSCDSAAFSLQSQDVLGSDMIRPVHITQNLGKHESKVKQMLLFGCEYSFTPASTRLLNLLNSSEALSVLLNTPPATRTQLRLNCAGATWQSRLCLARTEHESVSTTHQTITHFCMIFEQHVALVTNTQKGSKMELDGESGANSINAPPFTGKDRMRMKTSKHSNKDTSSTGKTYKQCVCDQTV